MEAVLDTLGIHITLFWMCVIENFAFSSNHFPQQELPPLAMHSPHLEGIQPQATPSTLFALPLSKQKKMKHSSSHYASISWPRFPHALFQTEWNVFTDNTKHVRNASTSIK